MRILIYSETLAAQALRDQLRAKGHHVSLRNPQYYEGHIEACDLVYAADESVLNAYQSADVKAELFEDQSAAVTAPSESNPSEPPNAATIRAKAQRRK